MSKLSEIVANGFMAFGERIAERERAEYSAMPRWTEPPSGADAGLMLRVSSKDRISTGYIERNKPLANPTDGFTYPESGYVLADVRGAFWGIYGLLDGLGDWNHLPRFSNATWQLLVVLRSECKPDPMGGACGPPEDG